MKRLGVGSMELAEGEKEVGSRAFRRFYEQATDHLLDTSLLKRAHSMKSSRV